MNKIMIALATGLLFSATAGAGGTHGNSHGQDTEQHGASAVGKPVAIEQASRTISVDLLDSMRFEFDQTLIISTGEVITFTVINQGEMRHEFSIGDQQEQNSHAKMMMNMPDMIHNDGNSVAVEPGETKQITWQFIGNKQVVFSCNIPGHYEAGMFAIIDIAAEVISLVD